MRTTTTSTTTGGQTPVPADAQPPQPTLTESVDAVLDDVRDLAPGVVGLTLCRSAAGGPTTLQASGPTMALLDALQHLDRGPAPTRDRDVVIRADRWPHLARGADAADVRSTRAVAVHRDGVVVGEVHLYAASEDACGQHADDLAALLDDADLAAHITATPPVLDESTSDSACRSLRADGAVHRVIGQLVVRLGIDAIAAHDRLEDAARHGGVDCEDLAAALVDLRP